MTSGYVDERTLYLLLHALMPENAFALLLMECTGMRIGDCLSLKREQFANATVEGDFYMLSYIEQKTGKQRLVAVHKDRWRALMDRPAKGEWLFPGRDPRRHRTRQTVFKDLQRVCKLFRIDGERIKAHISPHSARKLYAVRLYREAMKNNFTDALEVVRMDLNHKDKSVTMLYAMADILTSKNKQIFDLTI